MQANGFNVFYKHRSIELQLCAFVITLSRLATHIPLNLGKITHSSYGERKFGVLVRSTYFFAGMTLTNGPPI